MQSLYRISVISFITMIAFSSFAQKRNIKQNVEYSKNRKINLGALSIDGEIVVPDDLSVDVNEDNYSLELYKRKDFKDKFKHDFNLIY